MSILERLQLNGKNALVTGSSRGVPAYAAAKGGVAQLTKALANEWAAKGIKVNAIAPGYVATDNTEALRNDPDRSRQILERIPARRWGEPGDVAGAALFLCSSASDYIHGTSCWLMGMDGALRAAKRCWSSGNPRNRVDPSLSLSL